MSIVFTTEHITSGKFGVMPEIPGMINENKKNNIMANYFAGGGRRVVDKRGSGAEKSHKQCDIIC